MQKTLTTLFLFFPFYAFSQTTLNGEIKDSIGRRIDAATITLIRNNKPLKFALSDSGKFYFKDLNSGEYSIIASKIGYRKFERKVVLPKDSILIYLKESINTLNSVTISSTKPLIERKIDRIVFNVENSIIASAGTVWDAISRAPGVQTQSDGAITAQNKSVIVYIDDRPLRLSGDDLSNYLKSLPSDKISQIEIIANPPAKYDAQGAAIINIITKKIIGDGFSLILGSNYTQTKYSNYSGSAVFNYRDGALDIYGNYSYSRRKKEHYESDYVIFSSPGNYADWNGVNDGFRAGKSSNFQFGTDYNFTKNQVVGFLINGYYGDNNRYNSASTKIFNNYETAPDSILNTTNVTDGHSIQYSYNLNYKTKLDTSGQSINFDIDYVPFHNTNDQVVQSETFFNDGSIASMPYSTTSNSDQHINIWSAKVDYGKRIFKKVNFSAGAKYTDIDTKNLFNFVNEGSLISLSNQFDNFEYKEKTTAGYVNINGQLDKLAYQIGFRGEYTSTSSDSKTLDSLNFQNYFHLFPTIYLNYDFDKNNELNFVFGSRINRPDYSRLNPFKYYTSPYNYYEGNPGLKPAYITNYELGYTYQKQYNITFFYRRTTDVFSNITVQDNISKIFYNTQQNLDLSLETGLFASIPVNIFGWWQMNNFVQASIKQEKSAYLQGSYNYHTPSVYANTNQSFLINKKAGLRAEISAWYSSPSIQGIYKLDRTYDVSFGIRKTIFNGQGAIRIAAGDIFYGNAYRINVSYLNQDNGFFEKNDTRNIAMSISYRIGHNKVSDARKRKTASDDEQKRAYN